MTVFPQPFAGMTISDQLARHARMTPGAAAFTFAGTHRSYGQLDDRVSRLANAMAERGVGTGDRVAVLAHNGLEIVETYLACARAGAICVPLNFRLVADEIAYQLDDSGAVLAVVDAPLARTFADARTRAGAPTACLVVGRTDDSSVEAESYEDALRAASPDHVPSAADLHAPAFIMYTSGTTGRPKGAVLSHRNLLTLHASASIVHVGLATTTGSGLIAHAAVPHRGLSGVLPSACSSAGARPCSPGPAPSTRSRRSTCSSASACQLVLLRPRRSGRRSAPCPDIGDRDLSALRRCSWGAAPASTTLLASDDGAFPQADIVTTFGQTECCAGHDCLLRGEDAHPQDRLDRELRCSTSRSASSTTR